MAFLCCFGFELIKSLYLNQSNQQFYQMLKYILSFSAVVLLFLTGFSQFPIRTIIDSTASGITTMVTADFNNDGFRDLVVSQKYTQNNKVAVYFNNGNETFDTSQVIGSNIYYPLSVAVGDFNADGWEDVVSISGNSLNGKIYVFMNNSGSFPTSQVIDSGHYYLSDIQVADMDNDNDDDIILISDTGLFVYWNNGNGMFTQSQISPGLNTEFYTLEIKDIDNNGFIDIVAGGIRTIIYMNQNGNIAYDSARTFSVAENALMFLIELSDLDNDGDADLINGGNNVRDLRWYENDGNGFFTLIQIIDSNAFHCESVTTADFDADGDIDIFTTYPQTGKVLWYKNDGAGNFGNENIVHMGAVPFTTQVFSDDFNNDGAEDVVWSAELSIHFNQISVGVEENSTAAYIDVFPNPSTGMVNINAPANGTLTVYNTIGKVFYSNLNISKGNNSVNLNLPSQMYILEIKSGDEVFYQKLMIE